MTLARIDDAPALDLDALAAALNGRLLLPGDADYDVARRGNNLRIDAHPLAIVRAADASDVALAVELATASGLEIAIRSGGHSVTGASTGDGVLVIDLSDMKGLHVDPDRRLVWAQAGLTAGEVTSALAEHGLAIPFGDTATVGIAGLTLGGGIGYLIRKFGLAIDQLESVELVTADGRIVTASATEHPDLFWALRGGGGNFGIVTRFVYRAVPLPDLVYGGGLILPATREVLAGYARLALEAPRELTTISFVLAAPPAPFIPEAWVGKVVLFITAIYAGDPAEGEAAFGPFRALAEPVADLLSPMPYKGIYEFLAEGAEPAPFHIRSAFLDTYDEAAAEITVRAMESATSPVAMFNIRPFGGALADVDPGATAFAHRDARFLAAAIAIYPEGGEGEAHRAWAEEFNNALLPWASGVYSNFLAEEPARIGEAYPAATYARLAAVKRAWDPMNVFHRNQNIDPAG